MKLRKMTLKCDGCEDWMISVNGFRGMLQWKNKGCPKCGALILTKQEVKFVRFIRVMFWIFVPVDVVIKFYKYVTGQSKPDSVLRINSAKMHEGGVPNIEVFHPEGK